MTLTTDPNDPRLGHGVDDKPVPQQAVYLILSDEERSKGFVRPYRDSYIHVGPAAPRFLLRDLTTTEKEHWTNDIYVKFEEYPASEFPKTGRLWTQAELDKVGNGCHAKTTMGRELAGTWARNPRFYGATYCVHCQMHLPIAEFVWSVDGERLGS